MLLIVVLSFLMNEVFVVFLDIVLVGFCMLVVKIIYVGIVNCKERNEILYE